MPFFTLLLVCVSFSTSCFSQDKKEAVVSKLNTLISEHTGKKTALGHPVNTSSHEIYPVLTLDGQTLYFSRLGHPENINADNMDIWSCEKEGENWGKQTAITSLNNKFNNFISSITPDGNTLLLGNNQTKNNSKPGISLSHKTISGWSDPESVTIEAFDNKSPYATYYLCPDGITLLMCIENTSSLGDLDLFVSFLKGDSVWSEPLNLGSTINTNLAEATPYLSSDMKTLYFSSKGHDGLGGYDLFIARREDDSWTDWTTPENLGEGINSKYDELGLILNKNGPQAYCYSIVNKESGSDIFQLLLPPKFLPAPSLIVQGQVFNKHSLEPMRAVIEYYSLNDGQLKGKMVTSPVNGKYNIALPQGDKYAIVAVADSFLTIEEQVDLTKPTLEQVLEKNLYMVPVQEGEKIVLHNVLFKQSEATLLKSSDVELLKILAFLEDNPSVEIEISGHTDYGGIRKQNLALSKERAEKIKNYFTERGIDAKRIKTKAYGEKQPVYRGNNQEMRKKNRRVELRIIKR